MIRGIKYAIVEWQRGESGRVWQGISMPAMPNYGRGARIR